MKIKKSLPAGRQGFTLIELLVVIAIIGLLASIVMVSLSSAKQKARDAARISDIRNISLALEEYYNDNNRYPCGIYAPGGSAGGCSIIPLFTNYMPKVPTDPNRNTGVDCSSSPNDGGCYRYMPLSSGGGSCSQAYRYHLGAVMEQPSGNSGLNQDVDAPANANGYSVCAQSVATNGDFSGLSATAPGTQCNATAGTAQPGGTETCYDVTP